MVDLLAWSGGRLQGEGLALRVWFVLLAALGLAQCASPGGDDRFYAGQGPDAFVIFGIAEAAANTSPRYEVLWRRLDGRGAFMPHGARRMFEARTHEGDATQVRGIPGEFIMSEIEPGIYALDSVFAVIHEGQLSYIANGVVQGPERPVFEVRPGEAIYLGIWQTNIEDTTAVTRLWRLEQSDLDAVLRRNNPVRGQVQMQETQMQAVACTPQRLSANSQRQVC